MHSSARFTLPCLCVLLAACTTPVVQTEPITPLPPQEVEIDWSAHSGALIRVTMRSTAGVLLDEIPEEHREKFANDTMIALSSIDGIEHLAKPQIRLTNMRLNFRNGFYPKGTKWQLPLPPESQWEVLWTNLLERRTIEGHDYVAQDYTFETTILTDVASPGIAEPALGNIGGVWEEPFVFPIDPHFIFQRTGFACINEAQFPPNSSDAEESDLFYDHGCKVESRLSNTGCHQTEMPTMSCVEALKKHVGTVRTVVRFERLPWDPVLAEKIRTGEPTNINGPDLEPDHEEFRKHRFTYRYIPSNSCTIEEQCVGGPGWRKLLMFPTADLNRGVKPLDIGLVDYFHKEGGTTLSEHGMFELSECHGHYHFSHYGTFALEVEEALTRKNGFCMQPTARRWNNEASPLHHRYVDCIDQGVAPGWIDEYKMGLECQWLDVTGVAEKTAELSFITNPDGMLCEGTLLRDENGEQLFEPTAFTTTKGTPVDRAQCDFAPGWRDNNGDAYDVTIPQAGESYVTSACAEGVSGELRNCGFKNQKRLTECVPGKTVQLSCRASGASPQVLRVCEGSRALGHGIPCTYNDALASAIADDVAEFSFTCPAARDAVETGGTFSYMTAPLFAGDMPGEVVCTVK